MGNSLGQSLKQIAVYGVPSAILTAIVGSWVGSAVCFGPGTIIGAAIGATVGFVGVIIIVLCDKQEEVHEGPSRLRATGTVLSVSNYEFKEDEHTPNYGVKPHLSLCKCCTEPGKGCYYCDYSGTFVSI